MNYKAIMIALVAGLALSGCSVIKAAIYTKEFIEIGEEFGSTPVTAALPTDQTATYNGAAGIGIEETQTSGIVLFSDLRANAEFGANGGTMNGKLTDFVGAYMADSNAVNNNPASIVDLLTHADGELALSGAFTDATFEAGISGGPLTLDDKRIAIGGNVTTQFRGAGAEALYGAEDTDGDLTVKIDGAPHFGSLEFWGKQ